MTTPAPPWTDHNEHDPGITLLEVLVYTIESLAVLGAVAWTLRRSRRCRRS